MIETEPLVQCKYNTAEKATETELVTPNGTQRERETQLIPLGERATIGTIVLTIVITKEYPTAENIV